MLGPFAFVGDAGAFVFEAVIGHEFASRCVIRWSNAPTTPTAREASRTCTTGLE